jgi:hypothetical protein
VNTKASDVDDISRGLLSGLITCQQEIYRCKYTLCQGRLSGLEVHKVCVLLDILNTMLTWRCTKCLTSRYGKCHNIRENEIGESYTILSNPFASSSLHPLAYVGCWLDLRRDSFILLSSHYTCPWCIPVFVWCLDYHCAGVKVVVGKWVMVVATSGVLG